MYTHYFGFKERPFKLVPNPDYLYLSPSHEEALAHLTYAVSQGDGFLTITGEVGTGKTTLCRSFIERLDIQTVVAYIFNPKLDAVQLLKAINDEFGISSNFDNTKDLIDSLNRFLIEKKQEGKKAVLLIDEAQNLNVDVLEQLRLLSNLETTREKLLQIILVGQPELFELLESRELRQLAQRITLRRHLMPLNAKEVKEYVIHRINLASQKPQVKFTHGALKAVNSYANGIPRLINIVCDRSLLTAYGLNRKKITGKIVKSAIRELNVRGDTAGLELSYPQKTFLAMSAIFLAVVFLGIFHFNDIVNLGNWIPDKKYISMSLPTPSKTGSKENRPKNEKIGESSDASAKAISPPIDYAPSLQTSPSNYNSGPEPPPSEVDPKENQAINGKGHSPIKAFEVVDTDDSLAPASAPPTLSFRNYLETIDIEESRENAMLTVLDLWAAMPRELHLDADRVLNDVKFFILNARQNGLSVQTLRNNLSLAKRLNLPFILEIYWPEKLAQVYVAVYQIEENQNGQLKYHLKTSPKDSGITLKSEELEPFLGENAYIFWKNFYGYSGIIPTSTSENSIITLKLHIREMGFPEIDITPYYDRTTRHIVKNIQKKYQISTDGLVGPITKMALYNETESLPIPHIVK